MKINVKSGVCNLKGTVYVFSCDSPSSAPTYFTNRNLILTLMRLIMVNFFVKTLAGKIVIALYFQTLENTLHDICTMQNRRKIM